MRQIPLTRIVRLNSPKLGQAEPAEKPWALIALAGLALVGAAWWAIADRR